MKYFIWLALTALPTITFGMNTKGYFEIAHIYSWADYTNGTFKILLTNPDVASRELCPAGYWLDGGNDKNSSVLSTALSAYHSKSKVMMYADENQDWSGLSSKECKIKLIILE